MSDASAGLAPTSTATTQETEPEVIAGIASGDLHPDQNLSISKPGEEAHRTFLLVGTDSARLEAIRKKFEQDKNYWINWHPEESEAHNGYSVDPPEKGPQWLKISPAKVDTTGIKESEIPTDDWPQLYLKERMIPWRPTGQGMATIGVLSIVLLLIFGGPVMFRRDPATGTRAIPSAQMFFLGAGFMLLETKGVVHMALLFGSTWIVNSVVFFAILCMILIANMFVLAVRPRNLLPYYALLVVALLANALVPMDWYLSLAPNVRTIVSCAVVFVPVFFAGVIFASVFRDSKNPDIDFGSNVAGIILGGLSEQLSLMIGFNYLLLVAIGYYVLSLLLQRRRPRIAEPTDTSVTEPAPQITTAPEAAVAG